MGWSEELPSGRHRAMIRVDGVQRNATPGRTYATRAEARRVAGGEEGSQRQPGAHDPRRARMTWGEWSEVWWSERSVSQNTMTSDRSHIANHIAPRWSGVQLGAISRESVQRWVRDMERSGMAPAFVARVFATFSGSMSSAVLAGRLAANPCSSVKQPRIPQADERYLTVEEVERIAFHLDPPWDRFVYLLCGTGLRYGELAALHWHRVEDERLHVTLAWDSKHHGFKEPKDYERREVPLLDFVTDTLDAHRQGAQTRGRCGEPHPAALGQRCRSPLVFSGRGAGPVHIAAFRWHWMRTVGSWGWHDGAGNRYRTEKAALAADPKAERLWVPGLAGIADPVRVHDCRHTFASWFIHAGGDLLELAAIMGHHSVKVTERYAHLRPDRHGTTRARMAGRGPQIGVAPHLPHVAAAETSNVSSLMDRRRSEGA